MTVDINEIETHLGHQERGTINSGSFLVKLSKKAKAYLKYPKPTLAENKVPKLWSTISCATN